MNYIDLIERVLEAYTTDHIRRYTDSVKQNGIEEHGFPRLTANIGILIAHGKKTELKADFEEMMDICCNTMADVKEKNGNRVGNDFSVKEIVFCLLEIEKSGVFEKEVTDRWRAGLARIEPMSTYSVIAEVPPKRIGNWAAFAAASEQARRYAGIGSEDFFINNQIESQLFSFDENGMYRDPNEPMVYDFVTRLQLAVALFFGYDGACRIQLEDFLMKSADITLKMQSVTGEIPFGGRSNQFLHNESFFAALCEFYASWFNRLGDKKRAGMFKNAARLAVESILPWLSEQKIRHIKNYYPTDSMYGCEDYAYFDKYMVTTGSWLYLAHVMSDDSIEELPCPAANENYICKTSDYFHKVFCKFGDYALEFDTRADRHYDGTGLGRIQKRGVYPALCMSTSFPPTPANYSLDIENPSPFSICGGIQINGEFAYSRDAEYILTEEIVTDEFVQVKFQCVFENGISLWETYRVKSDEIEITVEGDGEVQITFPVFEFDGITHTDISESEKSVTVDYKGHKCHFTTDDSIINLGKTYANRNGHYKAFAVQGEKLSIKM